MHVLRNLYLEDELELKLTRALRQEMDETHAICFTYRSRYCTSMARHQQLLYQINESTSYMQHPENYTHPYIISIIRFTHAVNEWEALRRKIVRLYLFHFHPTTTTPSLNGVSPIYSSPYDFFCTNMRSTSPQLELNACYA